MPGSFLLPLIIGLPLLGAILVMCTPKAESTLHRGIGLTFTTITFLVSLVILKFFNAKGADFQLVFDAEWIPGLNAHFKTGVDGISVFLVLLTTFLMPITLLGTGKAIEKNVREFIAAILVLEAGMLGAFCAMDVFLFYVMWEVMLIPMYLLIGIWGGQRRLYASIKFVIYTMVGSLLMLVAIFYLYVQHAEVTGVYTTELDKLMTVALPYNAQTWCFAAFALAFCIKIPLFPLHTWLPDAHVEAPTAGSVILAGVMLKFGIFGFLRYAMPLFPHGAVVWGPVIAVLAVVGIIYGALVAFAQDDVKKLVAYSSVSHLGFCALGIFALTSYGISGSIYAMLSHGLTTGGLFLGIGVLYERRHTRRLAEYGGIWKQMPVFSGLYLIIVMGSAGLPALSGFIGEFLTLLGTFNAGCDPTHMMAGPGGTPIPDPMYACRVGETFPASHPNFLPYPHLLGALAATGVILGAIYLLWMFHKVFFGKLDKAKNGGLKDLSGRELMVFIPLVLGIFAMGLFPRPILVAMEPAVQKFTRDFAQRLEEPDLPAHIYGQTPAAPVPAAGEKGTVDRQGTQPTGGNRPVVPGLRIDGAAGGQPPAGQPPLDAAGRPIPGQPPAPAGAGTQPPAGAAPGQPGAVPTPPGQPPAGQPPAVDARPAGGAAAGQLPGGEIRANGQVVARPNAGQPAAGQPARRPAPVRPNAGQPAREPATPPAPAPGGNP